MKTRMFALAIVVFLFGPESASPSSPPWTGTGTYTFDDTDPYFGEGTITDTATVNITGGSFGALYCYLASTVNMSGGTANSGLKAYNDSSLWLTGGSIGSIYASDSGDVNMEVLAYTFYPDAYINFDGELTGLWTTGVPFDILVGRDSWTHFSISVVPEPCILSSIGTGSLLLSLRKRRRVVKD